MKTMMTFEFVAICLLAWSVLKEGDNKHNIKDTGDGWGSYTYTYNPQIRQQNYRIAYIALVFAIAGILSWIWLPLP